MRVGAVFPQIEIGADPAAVRDFAQAAESLGYQHLVVYDHVLGADASRRENWEGFYDHKTCSTSPSHSARISSRIWRLRRKVYSAWG